MGYAKIKGKLRERESETKGDGEREGSRDKREGGQPEAAMFTPHFSISFPVERTRVEDNMWQKYQTYK